MFPRRVFPTLLLAFAAGACGQGGVAPRGLAYGVPEPATVTYLTGDTADMDVDAGGQGLKVALSSAMTLGVSFSRAPVGVRVAMTVRDLDANMTNPTGPPVSADEKSVEGPLVFTMDRRGSVRVVDPPKVGLEGQPFVQPIMLAQTFFPRLPGRGVALGESWTDTVFVEGAQGEGSISATLARRYTAAGDTVLGGRTLLRIDMTGTTEQDATGRITGMDFTQKLTGTQSGWVLWDMQRALMVEARTDSDMHGSMEVSAAPFPLGVRVRQRNHVRLDSGR